MLKRLMNQRALVSRLARTANVSEASVGTLLEELARIASEEAKSNGAFVLPGIGVIARGESPECTAKNPGTGETIKIPARFNISFEFASRFEQALRSSRKERVGTLTTSVWKAPSVVLEAIERDFSAKEWETLDAQPFAIDENLTAVLDGYGDLFAYVLKIEGQFDPETVHGLIAGYVSPETLEDRASELQGVDLDALEKAGYLETHTSQKYGTSFESLKQFIQSAASENLGLIIVTHL